MAGQWGGSKVTIVAVAAQGMTTKTRTTAAGGGGGGGSCRQIAVLKIVFAAATVLCGLLHLQFQLWLDDIHNETPSLIATLLGESALAQIPSHSSSIILSNSTGGTSARTSQQISASIQNKDAQGKPKEKLRQKKNVKAVMVEGEFVHQNGVVIVTKIHGEHQWKLVEQSMCLFHYAYNQKLLYDIVVFTAEPIPREKMDSLQQLVAPARTTIVVDNRGLHEEIAGLSPQKRKIFLERCKTYNQVEDSASDQVVIQNLTWFSDCGDGRLAYNWQAEFRSLHIWTHPALAQYRWMMWMDTDAFCTKIWDRDPIAFAIYHNLAIFFDNYPGGGTRNLAAKIAKGFNVSLCKARVTPQGVFESTLGTVEDAINNEFCNNTHLRSVYGFLHITNLEFYRSPQVIYGIQTILGDKFLARDPDDQQAVTIPAAILAPERSWDMRRKGIKLDVFHNLHMDGKNSEKVKAFRQLWKASKLREEMGDGNDSCPVTESM